MTINDIFTAAEAATLWNIPKVNVRQDCSGQKGFPPRLQPGIECRKALGQRGEWLVTRAGMERLYGPMK